MTDRLCEEKLSFGQRREAFLQGFLNKFASISVVPGFPNEVDKQIAAQSAGFITLDSDGESFLEYTVQDNDKPIGYITFSPYSLRKGLYQTGVGLLPEYRGQGIMRSILPEVASKAGVGHLHWGAMRANYPSLRLLQLLGGGILDPTGMPRGKYIQGDLPIMSEEGKETMLEGLTLAERQKLLEQYLPIAKEKYKSKPKYKKGL